MWRYDYAATPGNALFLLVLGSGWACAVAIGALHFFFLIFFVGDG